MFHDLDPRSPTPLYAQIAARVRVAVAAGELDEGDALPSVRQLSRTLRVNPATVVQPYRHHATEGFDEMPHAAGTFVLAVPGPVRDGERARHAGDIARRALVDAARLGLSADELIAALQSLVDEGASTSTASES
ncbi:MAG: GntR family transcriptional regulator [Longimicrobiales bacterium]